jgi:hypothetical protein
MAKRLQKQAREQHITISQLVRKIIREATQPEKKQ